MSKTFLDYADLERAAATVAKLAKDENVDVALIGGFALQLYGSTRFTRDIDIIASDDIMELPGGSPLTFGGVKTETPEGVPVDLILRDDRERSLYEEALEYAVKKRGTPIRVVTPEHLAVMKLLAGRLKDLTDLEWLVMEYKINRTKTRQIIEKHFGSDDVEEFNQLIDDFKWRRNPIRRRRKKAR